MSIQVIFLKHFTLTLLIDPAKELAWINEVSLLFNFSNTSLWSNIFICHLSVVHSRISSFDIINKMLTNKAIEKHPQNKLLEVPSVDGTTHFISHLPDLVM